MRIASLDGSIHDRHKCTYPSQGECRGLHLCYRKFGRLNTFNQTPFKKIYEKLFPPLIRLGVDIDPVAKLLFEPLLMQLIHWLTKNATFENEETMALLDAIVDAVGNPSEGALRDFAARCLSEFFTWSIKQTTTKVTDSRFPITVADSAIQKQQKTAVNVKSLLKRLYSLAHHPNPYKRLGAALTFKQIYRVFREDDNLVDVFALEMLHNNIFSLRLAHNDPSLATAQLGASVIRALAHVVVRHAPLLLKTNKSRRAHKDLNEFVEWLFKVHT